MHDFIKSWICYITVSTPDEKVHFAELGFCRIYDIITQNRNISYFLLLDKCFIDFHLIIFIISCSLENFKQRLLRKREQWRERRQSSKTLKDAIRKDSKEDQPKESAKLVEDSKCWWLVMKLIF